MKKVLFFDLDGTLTNSEEGITKCVAYALSHYGIQEDPQNLKAFIGPPLTDSFEEFYGFSKEQGLEATAFFRERFSTIGKFENKVYDGIRELLESLQKQGYTMAVVTSKPEFFSRQILEHFQLDSYFVDVIGEDLIGSGPKSLIVKAALERLHLQKEEAVMIGDRKHDIIAAEANGVGTIGVLWGFGSYEELSSCGADSIVQTPKDLEQLLVSKEGESL